MGRFFKLLYCTAACFLCACVTPSEDRFTLEDALDDNVAIPIPMRITEKGLIVLEGVKVDGRELDMVLDTGATQSAIFETALKRLDLNLTSFSDTMVHGMIKSGQRRIVNLPKVEIGPIEYLVKPMVVLDDREMDSRKIGIHDGLIGMDVLSSYQIYVSPTTNELHFIPNEVPVYISYYWPRIRLTKNPFKSDDRALHFMEIRVDGRHTPAMLDTGAEFSAMNWPSASFAQVRIIRRRLKKDWELQGAIGDFKPTARVKLRRFRGGQMFWDDKEFIVMDFESLDILGVGNEPFMIAGMNLFKDNTIFMDFERDYLAIIPEADDALENSQN